MQTDADQRENGLSEFWHQFGQKNVDISVCYGALKNLKLTPLAEALRASARFARIKKFHGTEIFFTLL